jgi:xanthine dehydrogenase accessory factor
MLDFEVTVIDDRPEYANSENIPDADHILVEDIGLAMQKLKKSDDTYVVIVTRGHKDDAAALKPCIGSDLTYTGMIGSKKKIASMRMDFIENGLATEKQWNDIHAPVGLDIKSQTVEEIAVSISAQLVMVRNRRKSEVGRPE